MSEAEGEVGRRKSGFCLMRSVNCWVALSGEWARERRVWAMCCLGVGESVILDGWPLCKAVALCTRRKVVEELEVELELRKFPRVKLMSTDKIAALW